MHDMFINPEQFTNRSSDLHFLHPQHDASSPIFLTGLGPCVLLHDHRSRPPTHWFLWQHSHRDICGWLSPRQSQAGDTVQHCTWAVTPDGTTTPHRAGTPHGERRDTPQHFLDTRGPPSQCTVWGSVFHLMWLITWYSLRPWFWFLRGRFMEVVFCDKQVFDLLGCTGN